jgi:hypothetical protein
MTLSFYWEEVVHSFIAAKLTTLIAAYAAICYYKKCRYLSILGGATKV